MRRKDSAARSARAFRFRLSKPILAAALATTVVFLVTPQLASAEPFPPPGNDDPPEGSQQGTGFAFAAPRGFFALKFGLLLPRAESDIYTFNAEQLTLDLNSYNAPLFGVDVGVAVSNRVDLVFGFEYSSAAPVSEFRDFVDEFGAPITQQTRLRQVPLTAGVRVNLVERGRSVGSYAWVPKTVIPYVGGGGGITWWKYEQFGDFVDFVDFTIFTEFFATQGWAPSAHLFGGVDFSVSPRWVINVEGRYNWASGQLAPAFTGFEPIDLAGFRLMGGVSIRF